MTSEPTDVAGAFVWSPNGSRFAYYYPRAEDPSGRGAYIADSDQPWEEQRPEALPPLDREGDAIFRPWSWSPDGKWLAGSGLDLSEGATGARRLGIYVYSLESEQYDQLTTGPDIHPALAKGQPNTPLP